MRLRLKVKEIAEAKGYNQSSLARKADIDFKTVKRLFRDPYRDVVISTFYKISRVLKVSLDQLIDEDKEESSPCISVGALPYLFFPAATLLQPIQPIYA